MHETPEATIPCPLKRASRHWPCTAVGAHGVGCSSALSSNEGAIWTLCSAWGAVLTIVLEKCLFRAGKRALVRPVKRPCYWCFTVNAFGNPFI